MANKEESVEMDNATLTEMAVWCRQVATADRSDPSEPAEYWRGFNEALVGVSKRLDSYVEGER